MELYSGYCIEKKGTVYFVFLEKKIKDCGFQLKTVKLMTPFTFEIIQNTLSNFLN